MFGLLNHRPQQAALRADFRKSYCGTCKAIGTLYGHKERLLLNNDVVFLSELLAALSNQTSDFDSISTGKCFSLPRHSAQLPAFLAYTASINLLLASIKINDNIKDNGRKSIVWRALAGMQRKQFLKARKRLEHWGLKMATVEAHVTEQAKREDQCMYFPDVSTTCTYYAEMTGSLSGEIFKQSAKTAGKQEAEEDMFQIGKAYGEMVYLTDALQDYEKDLKSGAFNPFLTEKGNPPATMQTEVLEEVYGQIAANMLILRRHLYNLPIHEEQKNSFAERVEASIQGALFKSTACAVTSTCHKAEMSLYQKYQRSYQKARVAFAPVNKNKLSRAGVAVAAGIFALALLVLPFRLQANASVPAPTDDCWNDCWQDCCDSCCESCCNSCIDSICNAKA